jgi:hypothetical protein
VVYREKLEGGNFFEDTGGLAAPNEGFRILVVVVNGHDELFEAVEDAAAKLLPVKSIADRIDMFLLRFLFRYSRRL